MLSYNRLFSAFKPWEPVSKDGRSVQNAAEHGEPSPVNTEGISIASLNFKDPREDTTLDIGEQAFILTTTMKRAKQIRLGSNDKHSKPFKKSEGGTTSEDPSLSYEGRSNELSSPLVGQSGDDNSQSAIISDQSGADTLNLSRGKKMADKNKEDADWNNLVTNSARKGRLTSDSRGATGDLTKRTSPEVVERERSTKDSPIMVILGLHCAAKTVSRGKKVNQPAFENSPNNAEAEQQGVQLTPMTTGNTEGKNVDAEAPPKRKRGRPPKSQSLSKIRKPSSAANHQNGDAIQGTDLVEGSDKNASGSAVGEGMESEKNPEKEQLQPTGSHGSSKQSNASKSMDAPAVDVDKLPNESAVKLSVQHKYKLVKGKRGKRRTISSINIGSSAQDGHCSSKQQTNGGLDKDPAARNPEPLVEKSLDTVSDDQPLSRWFEGMHSSVASPPRRAGQSPEPSRKQTENPNSSPVVAHGDTATDDDQTMPFVKTSPLWQAIESMELFRTIPQNPHFRPLKSVKESFREGQAISQMVNFSKVVEETLRLRFDNPRTAIEERLETLVELESHGFDVKLVRNRLTGLLLIKDRQEELEARSREVGGQIEQENVARSELDRELEVLDGQIRALLARRQQILTNQQQMSSELAALEVEVAGIRDGMQGVRRQFDDLAGASL